MTDLQKYSILDCAFLKCQACFLAIRARLTIYMYVLILFTKYKFDVLISSIECFMAPADFL